MIYTTTHPTTGKEIKFIGLPKSGCRECIFDSGDLDALCPSVPACSGSREDSRIFLLATPKNIARVVAQRMEKA